MTGPQSPLDSLFAELAAQRGYELADRVVPTAEQARVWDEYDWSGQGYEWGARAWVERFLRPLFAVALRPGMRVLEIGPGAGRVTELLLEEGRAVVVADISRKCLDLTLARFGATGRLTAVHLGVDDVDAALPPESLDAFVSWDAFVHIDLPTTARYVADLARWLKPGACGIVHHPDTHCAGGWRSDVNLARMVELLVAHDFLPLQHLRWLDEQTHLLDHYDYVTLFRKGLRGPFVERLERAFREGHPLVRKRQP